jgi:hypothetical protein
MIADSTMHAEIFTDLLGLQYGDRMESSSRYILMQYG